MLADESSKFYIDLFHVHELNCLNCLRCDVLQRFSVVEYHPPSIPASPVN